MEDITLDREFAALCLPPLPKEKALMDEALFQDGCRRPLVVWPCAGKKILLIGYEEFDTLRRYRLPFRVIEKGFPSREAAFLYVVKERLGRRHCSELEIQHLRGLCYHEEKQSEGGDRRSEAARAASANGPAFSGNGARPHRVVHKTADALAEIFGVTEGTVRRDAALVAAVRRLEAVCGPEIKPCLLRRGSGCTRETVMALDRLPAAEQRKLGGQLMLNGKLPRGWRHGRGYTMTVPCDPHALAEALRRRWGPERLASFPEVILDVLTRPRTK